MAVLAPHSSTKTSRSRVHAGELLAEFAPLLLDLRAVLLLGTGHLLLAWQPQLSQGARDGHQAAREAEPLAAFLERGVGLLADQFPKPLQILWPEHGGVAAAVRSGLDRAGRAMEMEQP